MYQHFYYHITEIDVFLLIDPFVKKSFFFCIKKISNQSILTDKTKLQHTVFKNNII